MDIIAPPDHAPTEFSTPPAPAAPPARWPPSRRRRNRTDRIAMAEAWIASGLDARQFAAGRDFAPSSLVRWRKELADDRCDDNAFVAISLAPDPPATPTSDVIEIVIDGRHQIRLAAGFDEHCFARIVSVLQKVNDAAVEL